jgi:chemotaxis signal transduction protein
MVTVSSIIFQVDQDLYGLETRVVKEVIWVPELYWKQSLPSSIAGMFSYRGMVIPVLDLHQWVGGERRKFLIHDQVVIVEWQERVAGLLVDKVQDVTSLGVEPIQTTSPGSTDQGLAGHRVVGLSKFGSQTVKMLDLSLVLQDLQASATREYLDSLASALLESIWIPWRQRCWNERVLCTPTGGFSSARKDSRN